MQVEGEAAPKIGRTLAGLALQTAGTVMLTFLVLAAFESPPWELLPLVMVLVFAVMIVVMFAAALVYAIVHLARERRDRGGS